MKNKVWLVLVALLFVSDAFGGKFLMPGLTEEEIDQKVDASPFIKLIGKARFDAKPPGTAIEVHYRKFNILHLARYKNEPNAAQFKMGEGSDPAWGYIKIAEIEIYKTMRADAMVIAAMKKEAAKLGGDAITDCQRDPIVLEGDIHRGGPTGEYQTIAGYKFSCSVVRRNDD